MADTFDDEIIDLTELMEEVEPPKKPRAGEPVFEEKARGLEPESFDLGREISLDEELAAELLEPTSAPPRGAKRAPAREALEAAPEPAAPRESRSQTDVDFDALIQAASADAAVEEVVFEEPFTTEERPSTPEALEETPPAVASSSEEAILEPPAEMSASAAALPEELEVSETFEPEPTKALPVEPVPEVPAEPELVIPEEPLAPEPMVAEAPVTPEPVAPPAMTAAPLLAEQEARLRAEMEAGLQEASAKLREEIPVLLEGIVQPFMGELVHALTSATRDLLPGIVEKIIREEIEKLKKLD